MNSLVSYYLHTNYAKRVFIFADVKVEQNSMTTRELDKNLKH